MCSGRVPQQPPTILAPASIQPDAQRAYSCGERCSPGPIRLAYTRNGRPARCNTPRHGWHAPRRQAVHPDGEGTERGDCVDGFIEGLAGEEARVAPGDEAGEYGGPALAGSSNGGDRFPDRVDGLDEDRVDSSLHQVSCVLSVLASQGRVVGTSSGWKQSSRGGAEPRTKMPRSTAASRASATARVVSSPARCP